jgi:hypothetical protein
MGIAAEPAGRILSISRPGIPAGPETSHAARFSAASRSDWHRNSITRSVYSTGSSSTGSGEGARFLSSTNRL